MNVSERKEVHALKTEIISNLQNLNGLSMLKQLKTLLQEM